MGEAIPFDGQASGLEELSGASPRFLNCLFDVGAGGALRGIRQRPGISTWSGFPASAPSTSAVEGMCALGSTLVYVDASRAIYGIASAAATALSAAGTPTSMLAGTSRPQLVATKSKVVIAGGDVPQKWAGSLAANAVRLGGSPPTCSHIVALSTRLVANDTASGDEGIVAWSYAGETGHETWDALNFAEAEADPDTASAIASNTNELFVWGPQTLQVFAPDPIAGFSPIAGRTVSNGISAPYSPVRMDEAFVWLDKNKRFTLSDGRSFQDLSQNIAHDVQGMATVSDGWGFRAYLGRADLYGCVFPTEGRTWIWQSGAGRWSEWRGTSGTSGELANFSARSMYSWTEQGLILVGLADGTIGKLDAAAYTDRGTAFPVEIRSGFVTRGTDAFKQCKGVKLAFKRGQSTSTAPDVLISWRDDLGAFTDPERFSLGTAGDNNPIVELRSLGTYERRQWKIEYSADAELVFLGAEEDFTVADR